jgi:hypothetical protein
MRRLAAPFIAVASVVALNFAAQVQSEALGTAYSMVKQLPLIGVPLGWAFENSIWLVMTGFAFHAGRVWDSLWYQPKFVLVDLIQRTWALHGGWDISVKNTGSGVGGHTVKVYSIQDRRNGTRHAASVLPCPLSVQSSAQGNEFAPFDLAVGEVKVLDFCKLHRSMRGIEMGTEPPISLPCDTGAEFIVKIGLHNASTTTHYWMLVQWSASGLQLRRMNERDFKAATKAWPAAARQEFE